MDAATWTLIRDSFAVAEAASESERTDLLAGFSPEIRTEVESLLLALRDAGNFLCSPDEQELSPGSRIGPYLLKAELGRGGMGMVFQAERADGEYRRDVAIKIVKSSTVFTPEAQRRFILERQLLARLDHPNIVRLLDGGTERGRRYFVMELVEGEPLTAHGLRLALAKRIELFQKVCDAVAYAHQQLILHCDLKPANVLITAQGQVKVLDFGIARPLGPGLAEQSHTLIQPLSLLYASPEQFQGGSLSMASDIYSLGMILYEVLTGVNPRRALASKNSGLIPETEIPPPSSFAKSLPKDLDAIVLKALSPEPAKRYESAAALKADLQRFLEGQPVLAVPAGLGYLFSRFVRRHRLPLILGSIALIICATGFGLWLQELRQEARRFEDARRFIHTLIFEVQPAIATLPGALPQRKKLVEGALTYLDAVAKDSSGNLPLLEELIAAYLELFNILGNPLYSNLGMMRNAEATLNKAAETFRKAELLAPDSPELIHLGTRLRIRQAEFQNQNAKPQLALQFAIESLQYAERYRSLRPQEAEAIGWEANAHFIRALTMPTHDWQARIATYQRAADLAQQADALDPATVRYRRTANNSYRRIAEIYADQEDFPQGFSYAQKAIQISDQLLAAEPSNIQYILDSAADAAVLGEVYEYCKRVRESVPHHKRSMDLLAQAQQADPLNTRLRERLAIASREYANVLIQIGKANEAAEPISRAISLFTALESEGQLPAIRRPSVAVAYLVYGLVQKAQANPRLACQSFATSVERFEQIERVQPLAQNWRDTWAEASGHYASCSSLGKNPLDRKP